MAAGSSAAIRAGQAFIELATKDNLLIRGLNAAEARVKKFGQMTASIGLKMAAAGGGLLAPLTGLFKSAVSRGSDIKDLSDRFGVGAEKISALAYAFERSGVSLDEFGSTLDGLQAKMFDLADGSDETFRRFAHSINPRTFGLMTVDKQIETLIERINNLADPVDRARIGNEFFGASWNKIANGAGKSVKALRELEDEARRSHATMTDSEASAAKEFTLGLTAAVQSLKYGFMEIGKALFPAMGSMKDFAAMMRQGIDAAADWIGRNRGIVIGIAAVGVALVAGGAALYAFGVAFTVVGTAIGAGVTALSLFGSAVGLLLTPIGLVAVALAGLTAAVLTLTESGRRFAASFVAGFQEIGRIFKETWEGIVAAISKGDFELAGKIAMAGLKAAWAEAMVFLTEQWVAFKDLVVDGWNELGNLFEDAAVGWGALFEHIRTGSFEEGEKFAQGAQRNLEEMRRNRDQENRKFRDKQIADAKAERDRLRAELAELNMRASGGKTGKTPGEIEKSMWNPERDRAGNIMPPPVQLYQATKGTFSSSNLSGVLGIGNNVGQRQLQTQQQIRDRIDKTNALLGKLGVATFK